MTKIVRLQSSNVKRLVAVEIEPDGSMVIIGGKNGAGKSSLLDSIAYALAGRRASVPAEPVRKGERRAKILVELDNGLVVKRTFDAQGGSRLVVQDADGVRQGSPQTILDKLWSERAVDPTRFERLTDKEQADVVRQLAGLDTSELDAERQRLFDERTEVNREAKRLKAQLDAAPKHDDAPEEEVSVAALTERLEAEQATAEANAAQRRDAEQLRARAVNLSRQTEACADDVRRLEEQLRQVRARHTQAQADQAAAESAAELAEKGLGGIVEPDTGAIREQLRTAEETNRKVRDNVRHAALRRAHREAAAKSEELTEKLEDLAKQRLDMIAAAELPVEGLGFDEDGVTYRGVPFAQASQAERLRVSVAMGLAERPDLRVLLLREGSFLDDDAMRLLAELAAEHDAQLFVERVGERDAGAVIIEDGQVRGASAEDAAE